MGLSRLSQSSFFPQNTSFRHLAGEASCWELPSSVLHPALPTLVSLSCPLILSFSSWLPPLWPLGEGSGACSLQTCPFAASLDLLLVMLQELLCLGRERHLVGSELRDLGFVFFFFSLFIFNPYKGWFLEERELRFWSRPSVWIAWGQSRPFSEPVSLLPGAV